MYHIYVYIFVVASFKFLHSNPAGRGLGLFLGSMMIAPLADKTDAKQMEYV